MHHCESEELDNVLLNNADDAVNLWACTTCTTEVRLTQYTHTYTLTHTYTHSHIQTANCPRSTFLYRMRTTSSGVSPVEHVVVTVSKNVGPVSARTR